MRGTPYFYQGDEIGMTNVRFTDIQDYRDINTINRYENVKKSGGDLESFMESEQHAARENARTPMQWDDSEHSGFTLGEPWIKVNPDYQKGINVSHQTDDKYSVLSYFKEIVAIRKANVALVYGDYECLHPEHEQVYAYIRSYEDQRFLVLLNFSDETLNYVLPWNVKYNRKVKMISNQKILDDQTYKEFILGAWQAVIYRLED